MGLEQQIRLRQAKGRVAEVCLKSYHSSLLDSEVLSGDSRENKYEVVLKRSTKELDFGQVLYQSSILQRHVWYFYEQMT